MSCFSISSLTTLIERFIETGNKNNSVIPASFQTALTSNGKYLTFITDNCSQFIPPKTLHTNCLLHTAECKNPNTFEDILRLSL